MFWLAVFLLLNTVLVTGPVLLGRLISGPPQAATLLAAANNCKNPCWLGIQPGVTAISNVNTLLQRAGINFKASTMGVYGTIPVEAPRGWLNAYMYPGVGGFRTDKTIVSVCLKDDDRQAALLFGDILHALGTPDEVWFDGMDRSNVRLLVRYQVRQIEVSLILPSTLARLSLDTPIDRVCFQPDRMFAAHTNISGLPSLDWRGMASLARYYPEVIAVIRR
ncbi:MAG: hypothetical protein IT324_21795 [Anaerolineae bacterium]|nr:hypothetical protein [Anaerolineae bacterium]